MIASVPDGWRDQRGHGPDLDATETDNTPEELGQPSPNEASNTYRREQLSNWFSDEYVDGER